MSLRSIFNKKQNKVSVLDADKLNTLVELEEQLNQGETSQCIIERTIALFLVR